LITLRGIAKDLFKELGGGENFIRRERNTFADAEIVTHSMLPLPFAQQPEDQ
jgi:hypothetical protein